MHHKRGPLPKSTLPDEVWTQQDQEAGHPEDHFRVDPQHRDQSALEPHVLQGNLRLYIYEVEYSLTNNCLYYSPNIFIFLKI